MKKVLEGKAYNIKTTTKLESHPCVVTVREMASARHFTRIQTRQLSEDSLYPMLQPHFEINPNHSIIKKLCTLINTDTKLADLVINQVLCCGSKAMVLYCWFSNSMHSNFLFNSFQLFINSMVEAGLIENPRILLASMNELLAIALK